MRLIRDFDRDGVVDPGEELARSARGGTNIDSLNAIKGAGNYMLQVYQFAPGEINYRLNYTEFSTNAQGPLNSRAEEEFQVGTLSADLTRRGAVGDRDKVDSYAFSLNDNDILNLNLTGRRGDAYLRVVQDRNGNGRIERQEVVAASTGIGNSDVINGLSGAGDYLVQIW